MTGGGQFIQSNMGLTFIMLKPPDQRPPIAMVAGEMMGQMSGTPGMFAFLRPFPVLEISTGATQQLQGNYAFSISGVNPDQVYEAGGKLMARIYAHPDFGKIFETASSDYYSNTPNLDVRIRRDQARIRGVSETRILALLRNAYSQNFVYLIKKPTDQYQVILEADDRARATPEDLSLLYIRSDDGKNLVPLASS
jgi:HAE1 family hydrophobic/amphiphilic exporter-1